VNVNEIGIAWIACDLGVNVNVNVIGIACDPDAIESACALDTRMFVYLLYSDELPELPLKIKQLININAIN
jgi:hypothetical protein